RTTNTFSFSRRVRTRHVQTNRNAMTILFLHGWQSVPGGVKPTYLKNHGHTVINTKRPGEELEGAVRIAQAAVDQHRPEVVVGSSRGGAVEKNIDTGDAR